MNISDYVKIVRKKLNLSQIEFAKAVWPEKNPLVTQPLISRYESSKTIPAGDNLLRIQALDPDREWAP
jgi:transcriptional regulator with XRE-family HTH domain